MGRRGAELRSYGLIRAESGVQGLLVIGSWARV